MSQALASSPPLDNLYSGRSAEFDLKRSPKFPGNPGIQILQKSGAS